MHHFKSIGEFKLEFKVSKYSIRVKICEFFVLCDLEIWWMTLKKNRAPLLYHVKLCASFQSHRWTQTWGTVRKRSNRVKNGDFFSHVTSKLDWRPWKIIEHLLELYCAKLCASLQIHQWIKSWVTVQKRSIQVKIGDFLSHVISKFDRWPKKTIGHLF